MQNQTAGREPRIVVGVDGSPSSVGALRRGARIAAALDLPLHAIAAWHYPDLYGGYMGEAFIPDPSMLADGAQAMLDETVAAVFGDSPPTGFRGLVREGRAAQILIDESRGAEMLIVGSRGHGGFTGLLLGSVSEACAEHATCPVLVFHEEPAKVGGAEPVLLEDAA
ncbi:universal stress protein [Amnibacterium sp.]|uniref:universal stress protein n=1 Tax=Amnibacterium sp. TaxID=1872496 RepID=UPI00262A67BE|nr:universal stress protein [Amnibacterium sp.]MCU1474158.1 UspA domain protein [Amnibacterium sp.]